MLLRSLGQRSSADDDNSGLTSSDRLGVHEELGARRQSQQAQVQGIADVLRRGGLGESSDVDRLAALALARFTDDELDPEAGAGAHGARLVGDDLDTVDSGDGEGLAAGGRAVEGEPLLVAGGERAGEDLGGEGLELGGTHGCAICGRLKSRKLERGEVLERRRAGGCLAV